MPGINEQMEHRFKYEPDEHLNSPMLYQNGVPDYVEEIIPNTKTNFSMPGKAPKTPDSELTPTQLEQRNRRRRRNREAAARQRDRRAQIQKTLENELKNLREINRLKDEELIKLKVENENLREQMKSMYEASQIDIKK